MTECPATSRSISSRGVLLGLALALALAPGSEAQAGVDGDLEIKIELPDEDGDFQTQNNAELLKEHFNLTRCRCAAADSPIEPLNVISTFRIRIEGSYTQTPNTRSDAQLRVGNDCLVQDIDNLDETCESINEIQDIVDARGSSLTVPLDRFMFLDNGCLEDTRTSSVWITFDENQDSLPDPEAGSYFQSELVEIDGEPPPLAENPSASPGENAVTIRWNNPEVRGEDIDAYQVLCVEQGSTAPVFSSSREDPEYETVQDTCPDLFPPGSTVNVHTRSKAASYLGPSDDAGMADAGVEPDAGPDDPDAGPDAGVPSGIPAALEELDPRFICGGTSGTAESVRIDGLENGVTYEFVLVSVDDVGNFNAQAIGSATPVPVIDFWEDYRRNGGDAEGGICLITSTFGDDHWFTQTLRDFRDGTLAHFGLGRAFIDFYYQHIAGLGTYAEGSLAVKVIAAAVIAPLVGVAAFWEYTGPGTKLLVLLAGIWWLRRRRARRAGRAGRTPTTEEEAIFWRPKRWQLACAGFAGVWLAAVPAFAQSPFDPYWEEFQPVENRAPPEPPKWNFGIKAGPYLPAVDDSVSQPGEGPWERVFGGAGFRLDLELDRYFMWSIGQLGVTTSIGFMGKTANAFETENCTEGADCINGIRPVMDENGNPVRSGDKTSFRLFPISAGVVYRFTALDDQLRIPIVPYGKAALSYYLWWATDPDGGIAETDECPSACDEERALGASLGFQVTVGLAIRAERLDKRAALSLRNELGIDHAGFYAELTYAKVNGFGSDGKLPVGDFTWFGGLNFEF